jgi:type IV pilus assembly protein PilQ
MDRFKWTGTVAEMTRNDGRKGNTRAALEKGLRIFLLISLAIPQSTVFGAAVLDGVHGKALSTAVSQGGTQATIKSIAFKENALRIQMDREVPYRVFSLTKPPRVVVELSQTVHGPKPYTANVNDGALLKIRSAQFKSGADMVTRVVLDVKGSVPYQSVREGNGIVLKFNGAESVAPKESAAVYGEETARVESTAIERSLGGNRKGVRDLLASLPKNPITIDFEDAEIKDVLRVLSEMSGVNIIYAADLRGFVTIHLDQVPFNEVFNTILAMQGLVAQQMGSNVIRILTPETLSLDRGRSVVNYKTYVLNYGKAAEIAAHLGAVRISPNAKVTVDERNNALVVTDTPEGLAAAERLIAELDSKPPQVLIETKVVQIDVNKTLQLGVQWEYANQAMSGSTQRDLGIRSEKAGTTIDPTGGPGWVGVRSNALTGTPEEFVTQALKPSSRGTGVSLPGPQEAAITFGFINNSDILTMTLNALERDGQTKTLTNPKVITTNNQAARIQIGSQVPYKTSTVSNGVVSETITFLSVGFLIDVTPTINVDNRIRLKVRPEVSEVADARISPPTIDTTVAETEVMIKDGETLVIGGLVSEKMVETASKVPLLGDLPVLGVFFRSTSNDKRRKEILVFVTARVVPD